MTQINIDEYALIHWLESQALEAHNKHIKAQGKSLEETNISYGELVAYNKVLAHLRNGHTTELHRKLMEKR